MQHGQGLPFQTETLRRTNHEFIMRLTDLLTPHRVAIARPNGSPFDKAKAVTMLASLMGGCEGATIAEIEGALLEREQLQSTGIGEGVAIPHGALPNLAEQVAALLIVPEGVEFQAIDGAKVNILFGVITPKRASGEHLKTLARVSRLLRHKDFRSTLVASKSPEDVFELVAQGENDTLTIPAPPRDYTASAGSPDSVPPPRSLGRAAPDSDKKGAT
jgi:PTS system nitrogen regulatory IIA component